MAIQEKQTAPLDDKVLAFIGHYIANRFNGTKAAIDAGYSPNGAGQRAYELLKRSDVRDKINEYLDSMTLTPDEVKTIVSDMSKASLSDFIKTRVEVSSEPMTVSLGYVIDQLKYDIEFESEMLARFNYTPGEQRIQNDKIRKMMEKLARLELEFYNNPEATRIIKGPDKLIEVPYLDVIALAKDKERGRIKSYKETRNGVEVEMYSADTALDKLMRVHGLFNADKSGQGVINLFVNGEDISIGDS